MVLHVHCYGVLRRAELVICYKPFFTGICEGDVPLVLPLHLLITGILAALLVLRFELLFISVVFTTFAMSSEQILCCRILPEFEIVVKVTGPAKSPVGTQQLLSRG